MKFLHVSDIHFDPENDGRATRDLRKKFREYVQEKSITDVDEVFFTGDFRHAHKQANQCENEVVRNAVGFLRTVASCVGVKDDHHIHIVPGNHDLSRITVPDKRNLSHEEAKKATDANSRILNTIYGNYESDDGIFAGHIKKDIPSLYVEKGISYLDYLRNRFGFFEKCAEQLDSQVWADFRSGLIHRPELYPKSDEYSIVYVNTSIASGNDSLKHKLLLGTNDFEKALLSTKGYLVIILAHNPLVHLAPEEQKIVKNTIKDIKKPVIWLCGDTHEAGYENSYEIACITAGCMKQQRGTEVNFNVGEFTIRDGLKIEAHKYDRKNFYWQIEEGLSKRIAESIPKAVRPRQSGTLTVHNNLPEKNEFFSGRNDKLYTIDKLFRQDNKDTVNICHTISGLGGIGKTQLAIEYAYRYCGNYINCIWFVVAESSTTIYNYFKDFAEHFQLTLPPEFKPEELQWAVKMWLAENENWLIIFDNLETIDIVSPYLPQKNTGRILITSRNVNIDFGTPLQLAVFELAESVSFLQRSFSDNDERKMEHYTFDDFDEYATKLAIRLGNLPLALAQAAAYIRKIKCCITDYIELLGESSVKAFKDEDAKAVYYKSIVNDTWEISFKALSTSAQYIMNLCAYMAPDRIPVAFFVEMREKLPSPLREELETKLTTYNIFRNIRDYSLATGDAYFINIHRLVQEVTRKKHEEEADG